MMNFFKISLFIFFINHLTGQTVKSNFTLTGNIQNGFSDYIFMEYDKKVDSCLVKNNKFFFKGYIKKNVVYASFYLKDKPSNTFGVFLEKRNLTMDISVEERKMNNGQALSFFSVKSVIGSKTEDLKKEFDSLFDQYLYDKSKENEVLLCDKLEGLVIAYPENPLIFSVLSILVNQKDIEKDFLRAVYAKMDKNIASLSSLKFIEQKLYPENILNTNNYVMDFVLPNVKQNNFNTKELKGKWYLIEFWASWCEPCRKQIPNLKEVYHLFQKDNFEILGISIDKDKNKWKEALVKEKLEWINVIENKEFLGEVVKKFGVNSLPSNFLINNEGKIVAKNISPEDLESILKNR